MMFLCLPIIFIISISDTRSDSSFSVASSNREGHAGFKVLQNHSIAALTPRRRARSLFCICSQLIVGGQTMWATITAQGEAPNTDYRGVL